MRSTAATVQRACCVRTVGQDPACFSRRNRGANYFGMCGLCWSRAKGVTRGESPPHTSIKKKQERVGKLVTGLGAKLLRYQREMRASSLFGPNQLKSTSRSAMTNRVRGSSLGKRFSDEMAPR